MTRYEAVLAKCANKKTRIVDGHKWGKWTELAELQIDKGKAGKLRIGFIQQRHCQRCGKQEEEQVKYG